YHAPPPMRTPRRLATLPRVRLAPASFPLMLPTLVEEVPRGPGWLFELKWDGVRVLSLRAGGRVELWARSGARATGRHPRIAALLDAACKAGLEGVVAKRADARYLGGRRTEWRKIKCVKRQEFVIGGYTDPKGTRAGLGAVHLGVYDGDALVYAGRAGSGLDR